MYEHSVRKLSNICYYFQVNCHWTSFSHITGCQVGSTMIELSTIRRRSTHPSTTQRNPSVPFAIATGAASGYTRNTIKGYNERIRRWL
jgi:hypothetical protein